MSTPPSTRPSNCTGPARPARTPGGLSQARVASVDVGGPDMAPHTPHARSAPGNPWRSSTTRASLISRVQDVAARPAGDLAAGAERLGRVEPAHRALHLLWA